LRILLFLAISQLLTFEVFADECGSRFFWLVRDGLQSRASIDSLLNRAAESGANGLIVQVVGRGEAYYYSSILPAATFEPGFDPLAYTIARARPMGMEIHAWVNAFLVWSAPSPPSDSMHVWHAHPEWFMCDRYGRSTRDYTAEQCESSGIVGGTLSPAIPEARAFIASVTSEIATNYDVDGIHLDYIRYPNPSFGFEPDAVGAFYLETGLDPLDIFRRQDGIDAVADQWSQWKSKMVTMTIRTVRSALRSDAPEVMLSCAVMADPAEAAQHYSCDWVSWLEDGLVDFVCPMAYTTNADRARELATLVTQVEADRIVYGIGIYNQSVSSALTGAQRALARGAAGVCAFSINSLDSDDTWILRNFWGEEGNPCSEPGPAMFHRVSSGSTGGS
jgi:uncharacterized lipoprotein YddW (UPF0748 family)